MDSTKPDGTKLCQGLDALTRARLVGALTEHDRRMCASEAKRGSRVNIYRLSILLGCIESISEKLEAGWDIRRAILKHSLGRVSAALLKGIGQKVQSSEEARAFGH